MLHDTLEILNQHDTPATFFATHKSRLIDSLDRSKIEVGLHPNFLPCLKGQETGTIDKFKELLSIYPEAKGFRSHGLVTSSSILQEAVDLGLIYEANQFFPEPIMPFLDFQGLWRVPFFWRDTRPALNGNAYEFSSSSLNEEIPAIFCMHPVHIFLNTESPNRYQRAKPFLRDKKQLIEYRNTTGTFGARDFLLSLLQGVNKKKLYRISNIIDILSNGTNPHV